jgi:hypothetical protein
MLFLCLFGDLNIYFVKTNCLSFPPICAQLCALFPNEILEGKYGHMYEQKLT